MRRRAANDPTDPIRAAALALLADEEQRALFEIGELSVPDEVGRAADAILHGEYSG
jgi:hypothetical protein